MAGQNEYKLADPLDGTEDIAVWQHGATKTATTSQLVALVPRVATDVGAFILLGLTTATNAVITATDTIVTAFGKLQAQVTSEVARARASETALTAQISTQVAAETARAIAAEGSLAPKASPAFTGSPTGDFSAGSVTATSSTTARTMGARSAELFDVKDWGATGNGVTDDRAAIQAAINACNTAGGGTVWFPAGVYLCGATLILKSFVHLVGVSKSSVVIRAKASLNFDLIQTASLAALTGTNSTLGDQQFALINLSLDGNRYNSRTTGNCLSIYGYNYTLDHLEIYSAPHDGIYSEWSTSSSTTLGSPPGSEMEAQITRVRVYYCGGTGINFWGPHDSVMRGVFVWSSGVHGMVLGASVTATATGTVLDQIHTYSNTLWGIVITTTVFGGGHIQSESNPSGGIAVNAGGSLAGGNYMVYSNGGDGVQFNAPNSDVDSIWAVNNAGAGCTIAASNTTIGSVYSVNSGTYGIQLSAVPSNATIRSSRVVNSTGVGIYVSGTGHVISDIQVSSNQAGGVQIANGTSNIRLSGYSFSNPVSQLIFGTGLTASFVSMITYATGAQVNYSGTTPGNDNSVYLTTSGVSSTPLITHPDLDAWISSTPTVTAGAGAFASVTATLRTKQVGHSILFNVSVTITTVGTASGAVNVAMPFVAVADSSFGGRENAVTGKALCARIQQGAAVLNIFSYDGTTAIDAGVKLTINGSYET